MTPTSHLLDFLSVLRYIRRGPNELRAENILEVHWQHHLDVRVMKDAHRRCTTAKQPLIGSANRSLKSHETFEVDYAPYDHHSAARRS